MVGYDPERSPWGFDLDRAVDLLEEAGYPDGFNFTMEVVEGRIVGDDAIYAAVEGYLELAGITVDRSVIDLPAWRARIDNGNWRGDGFSLTWSAGPLADGAVPFALVGCGAAQPVACHPGHEEFAAGGPHHSPTPGTPRGTGLGPRRHGR